MSVENEDKLTSITCSSCGGNLEKSTRSYYDEDEEEDVVIPIAKCLQCGAEYDQHTNEYYHIFADDLTYDLDTSVFKLGLKGEIDGVEYEIIGRIRYQEEEEYEKSTWDEWVAISSDGVYHYFVEEEGKVFSYSDYIPDSIDLESHAGSIEFEGKLIDREEGYVGRLVYAEGELPWQPEIGESSLCFDFKKDGNHYSIEKSEDEVSITRGERIKYGDIIRIFDVEEYKEAYENTVKTRKKFKVKGRIYKLGILLSIVFSIHGCFSSSSVSGIMNQKNIISSNTPVVEGRKVIYQSQVLYGPFDIPDGNSLYSVKLKIDETVQRMSREWQSFRLMLISKERFENKAGDKMTDPVYLSTLFKTIDALAEPLESYVITGDFWDEDGYDSDGYWHESDLNAESDFVIDSDGKYYFYLELYNNKKRNSEAVKLFIDKIRGYRYYVITMVVFIFLWGLNSIRGGMYNELPFEMSDE